MLSNGLYVYYKQGHTSSCTTLVCIRRYDGYSNRVGIIIQSRRYCYSIRSLTFFVL
nr:MAG TPA: hypothetical protein [Caudovirales sp. ctMlE25]